MKPRPTGQPDAREDHLELAAFRQVPENAGLALDQLTAALAGMLESGDDPYSLGGDANVHKLPAAEALAVEQALEPHAADDACEITPRNILEAMLFVGSADNQPLKSKQVANLMRGVRPAEIDNLVRELNGDYDRRNCPYSIISEGAGYRLALRQQYARLRDKFHGKVRQARLSQAAIEVLAAVAYHEPITADEVSQLRGTPSGHILTQLVRRQLLRLERTDTRPRRTRYFTAPRFLLLFGLKSLDDLPRSHDLEEA